MSIVAYIGCVCRPEMEPGHGSPGQRFWPGRVGSRVSVSEPVIDLVLSFNMFLALFLQSITISA